MSITALLGVLFGVGLFIGSIWMNNIDNPENMLIFLSASSFLMVFGGTIATTFMSYQYRYVLIAFKAIGWMVRKPKSTREGLNTEIMRLVKWAYLVQKKGLPGLENEIKSVKSNDPIVRYCLEVVSTAHKAEDLRVMMETAVESEFERKTVPVDVLKKMAATAPAFGMIGTLVGLVAVLHEEIFGVLDTTIPLDVQECLDRIDTQDDTSACSYNDGVHREVDWSDINEIQYADAIKELSRSCLIH